MKIWIALILAATYGAVDLAGPPTALDDAYETAIGDNLSVDDPGVLENDTDPENDPLTAVLVTGAVSGAVVNLLPDGSFEYEPPGNFQGDDTFTYQAFDGSELSNIATVTVTVSGAPQFAVYADEATFLADVAALGFDTTVESFEEDTVWGGVRSTIAGGQFSAPHIDSMGVRWTSNNDDSEVTTSNGAAHTGSWGGYSLPHGNYVTGVDCHLPGNCTDGFIFTSTPTLFAAGGWIRGFFGSSIEFIIDGTRVADFGEDSFVDTQSRFFGVIDPDGFHSIEVHELEGTMEDAKFIWGDDFVYATPAGVILNMSKGPDLFDVTLQWMGGQPSFSVFRSFAPDNVLDPGNSLGQTGGRNWIDMPPPGDLFYFRVVGP